MKLRIFGCLCFPWLGPYTKNKLEPKSKPCLFLGYCTNQSAYRCKDLHSNRIFVSRHVIFDETVFPSSGAKRDFLKDLDSFTPSAGIKGAHSPPTSSPGITPSSGISSLLFLPSKPKPTVSPFPFVYSRRPASRTGPDPPPGPRHTPGQSTHGVQNAEQAPDGPVPLAQAAESTDSAPQSTPIRAAPLETHQPEPAFGSDQEPLVETQIERSARNRFVVTRTEPVINHPMVTRLKKRRIALTAIKHPLPFIFVPTCYTKALQDPLWREAMSTEFNALVRLGTWNLVPRHVARNIVGCKWDFRVKYKGDGSLDRFKARKGFSTATWFGF